jgi:hypothetical protein
MEQREAVAKGAGLLGASRGVILGIEIEDDGFAPEIG